MSRIIITLIDTLFNLLEIFIVADVILSFFKNANVGGIREFVSAIASPILAPFRILLIKIFGYMQIDFSPIIALIVLDLLKNLLLRILF
ncbi:MAG: YggT family protein [Clostridium sp.]